MAIKQNRRKPAVLGSLLLGLAGLLPLGVVLGQVGGRSPSEMIKDLTSRPGTATFTCGQGMARNREERAVAESLAALGASVAPDIEAALDSIEERGIQSASAAGSGWLVFAYARIKGPAAYPRLHRLIGNSGLDFLRMYLDQAVALSLGLTSYVSRLTPPIARLLCRAEEPRDTLDQVILAWERNDREKLEQRLGPNASAALSTLLRGRTWADMRAQLWPVKSGEAVAVGYRFETTGRWSEPEETLDDQLQRQREFLDALNPVNPELETRFKNAAGDDCGRHLVDFRDALRGPSRLTYLVDNPDLGDLLRLIAACATGAEHGR